MSKRLHLFMGLSLIGLVLISFLVGKIIGLEACLYCTLQRVLLIVNAVCFLLVSFFKNHKKTFQFTGLLIALSGVCIAWQHLSLFYNDRLVSLGDLVLQMNRVDAAQQQVIHAKIATYFNLEWVFTTLPFWSLCLFLALTVQTTLILLRGENKNA